MSNAEENDSLGLHIQNVVEKVCNAHHTIDLRGTDDGSEVFRKICRLIREGGPTAEVGIRDLPAIHLFRNVNERILEQFKMKVEVALADKVRMRYSQLVHEQEDDALSLNSFINLTHDHEVLDTRGLRRRGCDQMNMKFCV